MAERLEGTRRNGWRTTDHSDEIVSLILRADDQSRDELERLVDRCAASLLACHDETGMSLDDWSGPRRLVEWALGKKILENGV